MIAVNGKGPRIVLVLTIAEAQMIKDAIDVLSPDSSAGVARAEIIGSKLWRVLDGAEVVA